MVVADSFALCTALVPALVVCAYQQHQHQHWPLRFIIAIYSAYTHTLTLLSARVSDTSELVRERKRASAAAKTDLMSELFI